MEALPDLFVICVRNMFVPFPYQELDFVPFPYPNLISFNLYTILAPDFDLYQFPVHVSFKPRHCPLAEPRQCPLLEPRRCLFFNKAIVFWLNQDIGIL